MAPSAPSTCGSSRACSSTPCGCCSRTMRRAVLPLLLLLAVAAAACQTAAGAGSAQAPRPRTDPGVPVHALMDTCWPVPGPSPQRVVLTFIKEGGQLKDIVFEPREGAGNAVGRCLQQ